MTIDEILNRIERDRERHALRSPASPEELGSLEGALGTPLPEPFRSLLSRFGGGLFYNRHEIFGPRPLVIHDIVLVPDLLTFREGLRAKGQAAPSSRLIPFHQARGSVHFLALPEGRVQRLDGAPSHPDFTSFMADVVLPRDP